MGKLSVFNFITLNGFYKDVNEDIGWHRHGEEEGEFSAEGAQSGSTLLFGRVTYELMASYWPTNMARERMPVVAEGMNKTEKIVFSKTLEKADWNNTRIIRNNIVEEIGKMKQVPGKDMTILGSGTIVTQFAEYGLIDQYHIMIDPVALGNGTPVFHGIKRQLNLILTSTRSFKSGVILLCYEHEK